MITVTVKYLASFSTVCKKYGEKVSLEDGKAIGDLVQNLSVKYGRGFKRAIDKDEAYKNVIFLLNGKAVKVDTVLNHADELVISYPVGGG